MFNSRLDVCISVVFATPDCMYVCVRVHLTTCTWMWCVTVNAIWKNVIFLFFFRISRKIAKELERFVNNDGSRRRQGQHWWISCRVVVSLAKCRYDRAVLFGAVVLRDMVIAYRFLLYTRYCWALRMTCHVVWCRSWSVCVCVWMSRSCCRLLWRQHVELYVYGTSTFCSFLYRIIMCTYN